MDDSPLCILYDLTIALVQSVTHRPGFFAASGASKNAGQAAVRKRAVSRAPKYNEKVHADQREEPALKPRASLRSGFAWTLAGNGLYALSQWAVLSLLAKLGGRQMLGEYALAVAVTAPVAQAMFRVPAFLVVVAEKAAG